MGKMVRCFTVCSRIAMIFPAGHTCMQEVQTMDQLSNQVIGLSDEDSFPSIMFNLFGIVV